MICKVAVSLSVETVYNEFTRSRVKQHAVFILPGGFKMAYNEFTWSKARQDFGLTAIEGTRFFPEVEPVAPSDLLRMLLARTLPWATATGNEKARSEGIINPILLEVRDILEQQISVFSGEKFDVDASVGLNGFCDFLISKSSEQIEVEAPVVVVVEAKQENIKSGLGQCAATMVAAQRFNQNKQLPVKAIYGSVTTGTQWRFLKLEGNILTLDLMDYPIPPVEQILGFLVWIIKQN